MPGNFFFNIPILLIIVNPQFLGVLYYTYYIEINDLLFEHITSSHSHLNGTCVTGRLGRYGDFGIT